jgi:hypothetical protein
MNEMSWRTLLRGLVIVAALALALAFLQRFSLVGFALLRLGAATIVGLLQLGAALGAATLARMAAERTRTPRSSSVALDLVIGYPLYGALCFLIATVAIHPSIYAALTLLLFLPGAWRLVVALRTRDENTPLAFRGASFVAAACAVVVLGCGLVAAQAPPASLDEVAYHLAVPRIWVNEGRAVAMPLLSHSYFPLGTESADVASLALLGDDGGYASHLLHLGIAIAAACVILQTLRRRVSDFAAVIVAAAIITTPAVANIAGWSWNDWPLLAVSIALYAALDAWLDGESDSRTSIVLTVAAGLLIKYTFIPIAGILLLIAFVREKKRRRELVVAAAIGTVIGSIFFIRNLIIAGDPFAPFLGADPPDVSGYRYGPMTGYLFDGQIIDEALGAGMLVFALASLISREVRSRIARPAGVAMLAVALLLMGVLAPSARIVVPFLAIAAIAGASCLDVVKRDGKHTFGAKAVAAIAVLAIVSQTFLVVYVTDRNAPFLILTGRATPEEWTQAQRPWIRSIQWIDGMLPERSRTLVIGVTELYGFAHPVRGGGNFDSPRLSRYLETATPEALHARMRADGITHVAIISVPPIATLNPRKRAERETQLSDDAREKLAAMLDRFAANVQSRPDATLFTLK